MQDEQRELTHLDESGHAVMVDVGSKPETERVAVARGEVRLSPETLGMVREGRAAKGDVLAVARVAGIMGAKRTPELVPLCHAIMLTSVKVEFELREWGIEIEARAKSVGATGVEMEALTAVSVAALTIYDMVKAVERGASIENIRLVRKEGGKSGVWERGELTHADSAGGYKEPMHTEESVGYNEPTDADKSVGYNEPTDADKSVGYNEPTDADKSVGYNEPTPDG